MAEDKTYIAIDLKSYYASVECVQRGLDPLTANLVVADVSRTEKTICLAVSPSLKSFGIPGRIRLFELNQRVKEVNAERLRNAPGGRFTGKSYMFPELQKDPGLELDFIIASPRMRTYMDISSRIYQIYLKYVAADDIHIYSCDEVFIDATDYLKLYKKTAHEFTMMLVKEVLNETGITATAGIGANLYLCKIAMDIVAKHIPADKDGVRIAELDEMSYRKLLWDHRPLTDFWGVGKGTVRKLESHGIYTMGDIARCSLGSSSDFHNEDLLYKLFGVKAEIIIDHAWGWEPCTIKDIKDYKPQGQSISSGQVLSYAYRAEDARTVVWEMADLLALDLFSKKVVTDQIVLDVAYDTENLERSDIMQKYRGPIENNYYGKPVPKAAHGSINLSGPTSSSKEILDATMKLYDSIVNPVLLVRRMNVSAVHIQLEKDIKKQPVYEQLDMFTDYEALDAEKAKKAEEDEKERKAQEAILAIKERFGKNAILKGPNLEEFATARERNGQVGGHKG